MGVLYFTFLTNTNYSKKPTFRHHDAIIKTNLENMRGVKYIGLNTHIL